MYKRQVYTQGRVYNTKKNLMVQGEEAVSYTHLMSGVSIVDSLDIVADVISNRVIRKAIKNCKSEVMEGIPCLLYTSRCV